MNIADVDPFFVHLEIVRQIYRMNVPYIEIIFMSSVYVDIEIIDIADDPHLFNEGAADPLALYIQTTGIHIYPDLIHL
jgi:hypothetical protein